MDGRGFFTPSSEPTQNFLSPSNCWMPSFDSFLPGQMIMKPIQNILPHFRSHRAWLIAGGILCAIELVVALWLKPEDTEWADTALLRLELPADGDTVSALEKPFHFRDLPERLTELESQLSFTSGEAGMFSRQDLARVHAPAIEFFFFEFEPGNPNFINDVLGHAPEVCMEAGGAVLVATHPHRRINIEGQEIVVRQLEFERPASSGRFHVFRTTWLPEGSFYETYADGREQRRQRIIGALKGNPRPPARTLLAGFRNFASREQAARVFDELLVKRLTLDQ